MAFADLRSFLAHCRQQSGLLVEVDEPIAVQYEVSAVLKAAGASGEGPAVLFSTLEAYPDWQIAGNVLGSRQLLGAVLGTGPRDVQDTFNARSGHGLPPQPTDAAPVKEVARTGGINIPATLPIPTFHEGDAAPFVTAGVVIAGDPDSGQQNLGIHRMQVLGPDRMSLFLANPPLADYLARAEAKGKPLPVAVAIGPEPAVFLAAVCRFVAGRDKLELAGGLRGEPVPVVRAETSNLWVPAAAEVIIEGEILPGVRADEGPFGESTGYYFRARSPVVRVKAITHRRNPIFQVIQPWGCEVDMIHWLTSGAELLGRLREVAPAVRDLSVVPGTCFFQAVLSVAPTAPEEVRRIMHLALTLDKRLKQVIVVDEDVNIYDLREVMWAVATRFQAATDLTVISGLQGYVIDPSVPPGGHGSKAGLDATRPRIEGQDFTKVTVPAAAMARAATLLAGPR